MKGCLGFGFAFRAQLTLKTTKKETKNKGAGNYLKLLFQKLSFFIKSHQL